MPLRVHALKALGPSVRWDDEREFRFSVVIPAKAKGASSTAVGLVIRCFLRIPVGLDVDSGER